ncbi:MAG: ABC transporter permease, partial [Phycisphaerae bacterium]
MRPKVYLQGRALSGRPDEIVLDQAVADALQATLGQTFKLSGDAEGAAGEGNNVQVVGIVTHPQLEILQKPTVYLPSGVLMQVAGISPSAPRYNVIDLKLRPDADIQGCAPKLGQQLGPTAAVSSVTTRKAKFDQDTRGMDLVIIIISVITGTCAALIIGTTLSVGLQERVRQFGQLRSIGASRWQLVIFLGADALLMMVVGTLFGFLLGFGLSHLLVLKYPQYFPVYHLGLQSIIVAAAEGLLATLLGSLIPIWQVMRVTPMEAVRASGQPVRAKHVWQAGVVGIAALGLQALLWLLIPEAGTRFWVYAFAGVPLVFVGYCLLGPTVLLLTERCGAAVLGRLFCVQPALLRHAWSRTPWRAGGMIAALMVGVTVFAVVRLRGEILLDSFDRRQAHFPDLFCFSFYPVANAKLDKLVQAIPEASDASRITILPVELGKPIFRIGAMTPENKTSFVCIEPDSFRKMVDLDFLQGDPDTAYALLKNGNHVLVSREFFVARGIGVGGVVSVKTLGDKVTDFTVAAVVSSNG